MQLPVTARTIIKTEDRVIDTVAVKNGAIFVTLSTDTITVWHAQTYIQLHSVRRTTASLETTGFNRRIHVRDDHLAVIVQTTADILQIYDICEDSDPDSRVFRINGSEGFVRVWLKHRQNIRVEAGILAVCARASLLVLGTRKPAMVQTLDWQSPDGEVKTLSSLMTKLDFLGREDYHSKQVPRLLEILYLSLLKLYVWIIGSGDVLITRYADGKWNGIYMYKSTSSGDAAVHLAVSEPLGQVTCSLANGKLIAFHITPFGGQIDHRWFRKSILPDSSTDLGSCRGLSVTRSGSTMLLCFEKGWTLRQPSGHIITETSTAGNDSSQDSKGSNESHETPAVRVFHGSLRAAVWINSGYSAILVPVDENALYVVDLCQIHENCLLYPARLVHKRGSGVIDLDERHQRTTKHIAIDAKLLLASPLLYASTSTDEAYLAVAGRQGLACGQIGVDLWQTRQDEESAAELELVLAPVWLGRLLFIAVRRKRSTVQHEVQVFLAADKGVEDPVTVVIFEDVVTALHVCDNLLFVAFGSGTLKQFRIRMVHGSKYQLMWVADYELIGAAQQLPIPTRRIAYFKDSKGATLLVALQHDVLSLFTLPSLQSKGAKHIELVRGVETFRTLDGPGQLKNSVFAFVGTTVHIWLNLVSAPMAEPAVLELDFMPVSLCAGQGLVYGVDSSHRAQSASQLESWQVNEHSASFITIVLGLLLRNDRLGEALVIAGHYSRLSYFDQILESLLYQGLQDQETEQEGKLLARTWMFMENFGDRLCRVVVSCARKSEISSWSTLFDVTGDPLPMYKHCLASGDLQTAGAFLIVLHTMDTTLNHQEYTLDLIQRAKAAEEWELALDLTGFYGKIVGIEVAIREIRALLRIDDST